MFMESNKMRFKIGKTAIRRVNMDEYKSQIIEYHPLIWDPSHSAYKNKNERRLVWEKIERKAASPKGTEATAKGTWEQLSRGFANALIRIQKKSGSGAPSSSKEWKFKKEMMFLLPVKQSRVTLGSFDDEFKGDNDNENIVAESNDGSDSEEENDANIVNKQQKSKHHGQQQQEQQQQQQQQEQQQQTTLLTAAAPKKIKTQQQQQQQTALHTNAAPKKIKTQEQQQQEQQQQTALLKAPAPKKMKKNKEEDELIQLIKERQQQKNAESTRLNFFKSIMPKVDALTEDDFLELQMEVLRTLRTLRHQHTTDPLCEQSQKQKSTLPCSANQPSGLNFEPVDLSASSTSTCNFSL